MFTPADHELLTGMLGRDLVDSDDWPEGFEAEYALRTGLLARGTGMSTKGLGPVLLLGLVREFHLGEPTIQAEKLTVNNWRSIEHDTRIICDGRGGVFKGVSSEGTIMVKLDGYKALHEVPSATCTLAKARIPGVKDADLKPEPMTAAQEIEVRKEKEHFDEQWLRWNSLEPGTDVEFIDEGRPKIGKFMDIDQANMIVLEVDDEVRVLDPAICTVPEKAEA